MSPLTGSPILSRKATPRTQFTTSQRAAQMARDFLSIQSSWQSRERVNISNLKTLANLCVLILWLFFLETSEEELAEGWIKFGTNSAKRLPCSIGILVRHTVNIFRLNWGGLSFNGSHRRFLVWWWIVSIVGHRRVRLELFEPYAINHSQIDFTLIICECIKVNIVVVLYTIPDYRTGRRRYSQSQLLLQTKPKCTKVEEEGFGLYTTVLLCSRKRKNVVKSRVSNWGGRVRLCCIKAFLAHEEGWNLSYAMHVVFLKVNVSDLFGYI